MRIKTDFQEKEGIEMLKNMAEEIKGCILFTNIKSNRSIVCRHVNVEEVDERGNVWLAVGAKSDHILEIREDKNVQLFFAHPDKSSYITINGQAEIIESSYKIEKFYAKQSNPSITKKRREKSSICLIKVTTQSAYYWDAQSHKSIRIYRCLPWGEARKSNLNLMFNDLHDVGTSINHS